MLAAGRRAWEKGLRLGFLLSLLQAGVGSVGEFGLELFDSAGGVDVLQLTGVERVASVANVDFEFLPRATRLECVPTTAGDRRVEVIRMNAVFHLIDS